MHLGLLRRETSDQGLDASEKLVSEVSCDKDGVDCLGIEVLLGILVGLSE